MTSARIDCFDPFRFKQHNGCGPIVTLEPGPVDVCFHKGNMTTTQGGDAFGVLDIDRRHEVCEHQQTGLLYVM